MQTVLYNGNITIEFAEQGHRYSINGKRCVSVTSVTGLLNKPGLVFWSANCARDFLLGHLNTGTPITSELIAEAARQHTIKKTEAATLGKEVHQWASDYIKGLNPPMPEDERVTRGVTAFLKWVEEYNIKFISSEQIIYSQIHDYVGIMDCKFTMGRKKEIYCGDFKTGNTLYNEHRYQVSAYQQADAEESGCKYGDKWLVRFDKETGDFQAHCIPRREHEADFAAFLGLLAVKRREDQLKKVELNQ